MIKERIEGGERIENWGAVRHVYHWNMSWKVLSKRKKISRELHQKNTGQEGQRTLPEAPGKYKERT